TTALGLPPTGLKHRCTAHGFLLKNARRFAGADAAHRLEAEPDEFALELAVGQRLLSDRVDALEDWSGRGGRSEDAERGLRHHAPQPPFAPDWQVRRPPDPPFPI